MRKTILIFAAIFTFSIFANANPVNFSLTPDIAMIEKTERIDGFVLGIWSENPQTALTLGIVNGSSGDSKGVSLGFLGNYSENYTGAHIGIVNWSKGHFTGLQLGSVNFAKKLTGLQFGLVNYAETADSGVQIGIINVIKGTTTWFADFPHALTPVFPLVNWRFK